MAMTNEEKAKKLKETELSTFQKITTLAARIAAKCAHVYWKSHFSMGFVEGYADECGKVFEIRGSSLHGTIKGVAFFLPLAWLSESYLKQLWTSYVKECEYNLTKECYNEVTRGLLD